VRDKNSDNYVGKPAQALIAVNYAQLRLIVVAVKNEKTLSSLGTRQLQVVRE